MNPEDNQKHERQSSNTEGECLKIMTSFEPHFFQRPKFYQHASFEQSFIRARENLPLDQSIISLTFLAAIDLIIALATYTGSSNPSQCQVHNKKTPTMSQH
jgi:hypothetical protein